MVPWEIVINLSHVILYWSLYHSIDVLVDNGWIWTIKKAFILTQAVRSYSYKINHHNDSSSTIEFTYCVHFGDEHLKNLAFMKSAGNETITSAWQSRNLRGEKSNWQIRHIEDTKLTKKSLRLWDWPKKVLEDMKLTQPIKSTFHWQRNP